ncbi:Uncharacterized protein TPAR_05931 [Tolypocladium paradoxum]|uniref:Uncharacterized protein n=1 Tax=Tolypocladium paradoxum TaxID=94208 RepID=A0A2S4KUM4_9HYPO|nr:Uncharacterized protein TPAR_05931 [Tolypocladium paradoxum]
MNSLCVVCCTASSAIFVTVPHYWIKWWIEGGTNHSIYYLVGYIMLALVAWTSANGTMWSTCTGKELLTEIDAQEYVHSTCSALWENTSSVSTFDNIWVFRLTRVFSSSLLTPTQGTVILLFSYRHGCHTQPVVIPKVSEATALALDTNHWLTSIRFGQDITLVDRHLPAAFSALCHREFMPLARVMSLY